MVQYSETPGVCTQYSKRFTVRVKLFTIVNTLGKHPPSISKIRIFFQKSATVLKILLCLIIKPPEPIFDWLFLKKSFFPQ